VERPKLLLADDSVTIRKVVELTFADEGIDVTAVADADTAMQRFVETEPDIVLVDASLAGTSGYRICEMIKADDATKHIPVLLLVGSFERFDDDEAVRVGADGFMTKPFQSIRELVAKVRDLLGSREELAASESPEPLPVPVFGEAFFESSPHVQGDGDSQPAGVPEDDIDHLYRESFGPEEATSGLATTEPHFERKSADEDYLGHVGMDDDMIEASPRMPASFSDDIEPVSIPLRDNYDPDTKFDWSPDALVSDPEPEPPQQPAFEPRFVFTNDEPAPVPDNSNGQATESEPSDLGINGMDTLEMDPADLHTADEHGADDPDDDSEILDLDIGPSISQRHEDTSLSESTEVAQPVEKERNVEFLPEFDDEPDPAIHDTIPYAVGEQPPILDPEEVVIPDAFPPELVDKIAQRVIEKLSDSVVREIARIEVPRVAEKLIREALDGRK
jgi:CheY-like chemotaxis protein